MNLLRKCISNLASQSLRPISSGIITSAKTHPSMNLSAIKDAAKRIVWVDLEMTGLDIEKDHILEIACIVTDAQLNVVATGPCLIINQPDEVLNSMGPWCVAQHGEGNEHTALPHRLVSFKVLGGTAIVLGWRYAYHQSGLTEASRKSNISLKQAEKEILNFLEIHTPKSKCPLGGNTVYMDRLFLKKYMPFVDQHLHYRIIDVSTIKELGKRWFQKEFSDVPQKKFKHRTMDDILESIEELRYYKKSMFKS